MEIAKNIKNNSEKGFHPIIKYYLNLNLPSMGSLILISLNGDRLMLNCYKLVSFSFELYLSLSMGVK